MEAIILQIFIFLQIFYYPSNIFFARCIWGNITGYSPVLDQSRASETLCWNVKHNIYLLDLCRALDLSARCKFPRFQSSLDCSEQSGQGAYE